MLVVTDAIVLHAFDYLETSRILRLLTQEAGVQSVLAKGARRSRGRVSSAVDLFAQGEAQLYLKPTRELHTLTSFDVTTSRAGLALDMDRFLASSAIVELTLRLGGGEANAPLYRTVADTLNALVSAPQAEVAAYALAGAWRSIAASGFTPSLEQCSTCLTSLPQSSPVRFSHSAGGALCDNCARLAPASRRLPFEALSALQGWLREEILQPLSVPEVRAHQRLLREFLTEHYPGERPLHAFAVWESGI